MAKLSYKTSSKTRFRVQADPSLIDDTGACSLGGGGEPDGQVNWLEIISDPQAHEDDWIAACHELERHKHECEKKAARGKKRRRLTWVVSSLVLIGTGVGGCAYFHLGPFWIAPPPSSAAAEVDYGPYMGNLEKIIKKNWSPPAGTDSHKIILHFKVARNGEISKICFDRLSRQSEADAAALKSVIETMRTAPPLPAAAPESVDVQFTFDYLVNEDK